jgi:DNA-binding transcriptional LysR family regulator
MPPDWEGIRLFLEIIRRKSFRAASEALNISVNALRRRFDEFEQRCGVTLVVRDAYGVHMTHEGAKVFAAAEGMEAAYFEVIRARDQTEETVEGRVKLAVTEGLGTFWLGPRLVEFQRAYPKLMVHMHCAMSPADILRQEADVSVQLTMPEDKDLKVVKLGTLHTMPFAARSYVDLYSRPRTLADLVKHRLVIQVSAQVDTEDNFAKLFANVPMESVVALQSNVSSAHYWAIAKGAGVGMLPTYANAMGAPVIALDVRMGEDSGQLLRRRYDIWLAYHPQGHRVQRVRRLIEWVKDAFSPKDYPWFSDEFVHPNDLPLTVDGLPLMNLFAGFSANETALKTVA